MTEAATNLTAAGNYPIASTLFPTPGSVQAASEYWRLESLGKGLFRFTSQDGVHSSEFVLFDLFERVPKDERQ